MLGRPGRYLREPNAETRRAFIRTLGGGSLDVYLETPDTLALILQNLETFVPLLVAAQTPPFVPDEGLQAWFRAVAPRHRAEMVRALSGWLLPGSDSIARYHGSSRWEPIAEVQSSAAQRLADWDAREALPGLRALRGRLGAEARDRGADALKSLEQLDDALRRLEGVPGVAPLTPDGRGGFRSRFRSGQILTARVSGSSHQDPEGVLLEPAERESLWNMVLVARETLFLGRNSSGRVEISFDDGSTARLGSDTSGVISGSNSTRITSRMFAIRAFTRGSCRSRGSPLPAW